MAPFQSGQTKHMDSEQVFPKKLTQGMMDGLKYYEWMEGRVSWHADKNCCIWHYYTCDYM